MKKSLLFLALAVAWTGALADAAKKPQRLSDADLDQITAGGLISDPGSSTLIRVTNEGNASINRLLPNGKRLCINCTLPPPPPPPPPPGGGPGGPG